MGFITAVTPRISAIFVIFEPYAFPRAIPGDWLIAACTDTISSGEEVPNPTISIPISNGDIPKWFAKEEAPFTNIFALQTSTRIPRITAVRGIITEFTLSN
jgi:hypothetical protein